ncbi:nucleotidyltransferase domain-containing protein [Tropicimonas sp. IMCC34011]|uniref:nucleotidyltransferase domain-containing protein n=1 Tax=Tropicimonas sp. IMCC34011 TaxID=2248759 RepID=UPI00130089B8|nr:nucleotidyltransferase domain-containing protein [Tropicimonas sp. IMCC34011]
MVGIDEHIRMVLARYHMDTGLYSPVRGVQGTIDPVLRRWGNQYIVDIRPSGSFAKGTAVHGGTDIDIFISLTSSLREPLQSIYDTLFNALSQAGYAPRRQNVSIGIRVGGWKVDVTPGRRQDQYGNYHSLWSNKTSSWLQTNINEHIRVVSGSGRINEIRLLKIWRNRLGLNWPSFYLELFVIDALTGARGGAVQANVVTVFRAIDQSIETRRLIDPSNTNNAVSATLTTDEKAALAVAARSALNSYWKTVFQ